MNRDATSTVEIDPAAIAEIEKRLARSRDRHSPRVRYIVEPGRPVATGPTVRLRYIPCSRCGTERPNACNLSGCPKLTGD